MTINNDSLEESIKTQSGSEQMDQNTQVSKQEARKQKNKAFQEQVNLQVDLIKTEMEEQRVIKQQQLDDAIQLKIQQQKLEFSQEKLEKAIQKRFEKERQAKLRVKKATELGLSVTEFKKFAKEKMKENHNNAQQKIIEQQQKDNELKLETFKKKYHSSTDKIKNIKKSLEQLTTEATTGFEHSLKDAFLKIGNLITELKNETQKKDNKTNKPKK
jgi:hypothetical protein